MPQKQSGEKILALHTSEFHDSARHIYESMGFKIIKELEPIYSKKYWLYNLHLDVPKDPITYYKAGKKDLQVLIEMRIGFSIELTGIHSEQVTNKLKENLKQYFIKVLENKTAIFYLAKSNDKVVGMGGLVIREQPGNFKNPEGKTGYLLNMFTLPAFAGKGICSKILNLLVEDAKQTGISFFELHATKEGEMVYKQHGFEIHDEPTYRRYTE